MKARITIRDIATKADVHFTTVSKALRNDPKLPEKTCERIQTIARKMGYRPDPMLSALNYYRHSHRESNHRATLGWLSNYKDEKEAQNYPLYGSYLKSAIERAKELGYSIDQIFLRAPGMTVKRIHDILRARCIDGLLIAPLPSDCVELSLDWGLFSAVTLGHSLQKPELHTIVPDQYESMRKMLIELRDLGYKRIGVAIDRKLDLRAKSKWQAGFWVDYHGLCVKDRVKPFFYEFNDKSKGFIDWFKAQKPQAIGVVGTGLLGEIASLQLKIPQQLGLTVCGTDNQHFHVVDRQVPSGASGSDALTLSVSGVYEDRASVASLAVERLISMLAHREKGIPKNPQCFMAEGIWLPGETVVKQKLS